MNCEWYQDGNGLLLFCRRRTKGEKDGVVLLDLESQGQCVETFVEQGDEMGSVLGVWSFRRMWPAPECTGWDWKPNNEPEATEEKLYWVRYEGSKYRVLVRGRKEDIPCSDIREATREDLQFGSPL